MNIIKTLESWAEKNEGVVSTNATIIIKNKDIDIKVQGDSLESAYSKLEKLLTIEEEPHAKKEEKPVDKKVEDAFKGIAPSVPPAPQPVPATKPDDFSKALDGKQLLRIYDGNSSLNIGEELLTIGTLTYVVKKI